MQIGVLGINHKLAKLGLRDRFAKVCEKRFHPRFSRHEDQAFVLLSTCNRTELYFSSEDLGETHTYLLSILREEVKEEFDQKLYSFFGHECFTHLCRVTVGLDSALLAETEIQGQVKTAYENTLLTQKLPPELHYLFQKALKIGKQIRTELDLGKGIRGLDTAVLSTGRHFFDKGKSPSILFVGGSSINEKILSKKPPGDSSPFLMTRSIKRGEEFKEKYGVIPIAWNPDEWDRYDWIISGTKTDRFLITPKPLSKPKLIMDLSVPRNVDPILAKDPHVTLLNIDQLNRLLQGSQRRLKDALIKADHLIKEHAYGHVIRYQEKAKRSGLMALVG